ncbi:hypothetical protein A3H85_00055 [Candidatus Daviesbacteria bacterium RIFCSPLOWO2_02_FULL_40_8]|uniref:Uncharacterized protein n=1 Tax=Candidatus Daviesbacteria bacterium RIFCSPLOWO2_01_FULL_40_24 TaxID=1797787 RepID=A0A1F5MKC4_9BACT|nr:MAG: hypothetical protein A3B49_03180 [Candidatus Daviesbacteria bacterium RIFCSPLOWO2_01_FULL_40_24]OGE66837.1 MAG: hypothetical protein A3H85_00055 [Candidatus Daviesbacteria bacterium RIFCSPLOWO2_02_FULL_40_8]
MKNKKVWIFSLLIISVGSFFYFGKSQGRTGLILYTFLSQEYNNKFTLRTWPIENFLVSSANSSTYCCGENSVDPFDEKATPSVIVQNLSDQKIRSIYEISFTTSATDGKFDKGNIIYLSDEKQIKEYFVAEWNIDWGGSAGLKGMAIFGNKDGQFQPISGYPFPNDFKSSINITDKLSNKKYSFPITGDSNFSEVTDLNNDGKLDLLYADWKWDFEKGESHYQSRPWNLQVFELVANTFRVAEWWNGGEIYRTPENIGYSDADTVRLKQIFYEKSK